VAVAACKDPGAYNNEVDVLTVDPLRYGVASSTGAQNDTGRPVAPQDIQINAIIMAGSPDVTFGLGSTTSTADSRTRRSRCRTR
jgi:hypothetical protein